MFLFVICFFVLSGAVFAQPTENFASKSRIFVVKVKLTGYDSCTKCCEAFAGGKRTSTGRNARIPDGVAAAPKLVPYRSQVYIPALKENRLRLVDDTGGGMRRYARRTENIQFDVRFRTHREALRFGTREAEVLIILHDPTPEQIAYFTQKSLYTGDSSHDDVLQAFLAVQQDYATHLLKGTLAGA